MIDWIHDLLVPDRATTAQATAFPHALAQETPIASPLGAIGASRHARGLSRTGFTDTGVVGLLFISRELVVSLHGALDLYHAIVDCS